MSDLVDYELIDRLRSGDCCVENNDDAAEHIEALADEIERLKGDLQVTRLQRDARMVSEFVVDDAVKAEIERLKAELFTMRNVFHQQDAEITRLRAALELSQDYLVGEAWIAADLALTDK